MTNPLWLARSRAPGPVGRLALPEIIPHGVGRRALVDHEERGVCRVVEVGHSAFKRCQRQAVLAGEVKQVGVGPLPVPLQRTEAEFGEG